MLKFNARKTGKILFRLALFFVLAMGLVLMILANIGGQNEQLKEGAESFLSKITNSRALIGELTYLGFLPSMRLDAKNIIFQEIGDPTHNVMTIEGFEISMPFHHYVLNKQTFEQITLSNLKSEAGFLTPKALTIQSVFITEDAHQHSALRAIGTYGMQDFIFEAQLETAAAGEGKQVYKVQKVTPLFLDIGNTSIAANLTAHDEGTSLQDIHIFRDNVLILEGIIDIFLEDEKRIAGELARNQSAFTINLDFSKPKEESGPAITGTVKSKHADWQDMDYMLDTLDQYIRFFLTDQNGALISGLTTDIDLDIETLDCGDNTVSKPDLYFTKVREKDVETGRILSVSYANAASREQNPCANHK